MTWKGESNRHAMAARGVQTARNTRNDISHYKLTGNDKSIITTRTIKPGQKAYYFGDMVGIVVAVGTAQELVDKGYDSTGAMQEGIDELGYGEYDTLEESQGVLSIAVIDENDRMIVYVLGGGGIDEIGD